MNRRLTAITAALCALLALACSSGGDDTASDEPSAAPPAATSPAASGGAGFASAEAAVGIPPSPDATTQAAYLAALKAINPAIVGDKTADTMVDRGRDQCRSIHEHPNDRPKLVDLTNKRFTAPGKPDGFGLPTAAKILAVVHQHICPSYPIAAA